MIAALLLLAAAAPVPVIDRVEELSAQLKALQADGQPVIVHFFATWCAPCREEIPVLKIALKQAAKRGAKVALLSLDDPKDMRQVQFFLKKTGYDGPAWILTVPDPEPVAALLDPKWSGGLPATFVLQREKVLKSLLKPLRTATTLLEALPEHLE